MADMQPGIARRLAVGLLPVALAVMLSTADALAQEALKDDPTLRLRVYTLRKGNVYVDGELPMSWNVVIHNDAAEARDVTLEARIVDFWGHELLADQYTAKVPAKSWIWWPFDFSPPDRGVFHVHVDALLAGAVAEQARTAAGWIPPPPADRGPADESVFGLYAWAGYEPWGYIVGSLRGFPPQGVDSCAGLDLAAKAGCRWIKRMFEWDYIEPAKGEHPNIERWDVMVQKARELGMTVTGMLVYSPRWCTLAPETARGQGARMYPPADLEQWAEFVRFVVGRYKGKVHTWEAWNEPNSSNFMGSAEQFVELLKVTYNAAKEADPDCQVMWNTGGLDYNFIEAVYRLGGTPYFDIQGVHGYIYWGEMDTIYRLRLLMQEHGIGDREIWSTEEGWGGMPRWYDPKTENFGAAQVMQRYTEAVVMKRWGFKREMWLTAVDGLGNSHHDLWYPDLAPRPLYVAYAVTSHMLDGSRFVSSMDIEPRAKIRNYLFARGQEPVLYVCNDKERYNPGGAPSGADPQTWKGEARDFVVPIALPVHRPEVTVVDIMGRERRVVRGKDGTILLPVSKAPQFVTNFLPPVWLSVDPVFRPFGGALLAGKDQTVLPVAVTVHNASVQSGVRRVRLALPDGWNSQPAEAEVSTPAKSETNVPFNVVIPAGTTEGDYRLVAQMADGQGGTLDFPTVVSTFHHRMKPWKVRAVAESVGWVKPRPSQVVNQIVEEAPWLSWERPCDGTWLELIYGAPVEADRVVLYPATDPDLRGETLHVQLWDGADEKWHTVTTTAMPKDEAAEMVLRLPKITKLQRLRLYYPSPKPNVNWGAAIREAYVPGRGAPTLVASSMLNEPQPNPPERAIDGDPNIAWKTDKLPAWLVVDYGTEVGVRAVEVLGKLDAADQCAVDVWLDAEGKWQEQTSAPTTGKTLQLRLPQTTSTSRLRLRFTAKDPAGAAVLEVGEVNVDIPQGPAP